MVTPGRTRRDRGYTLIEVACAFAVLSVLATTIFLGQGQGVRAVATSFHETTALNLAAGRLEQLGEPDAELRVGKSRFEIDQDAARLLALPRAYQEIEDRGEGLYEVTTEVSWLENQSKPRRRIRLTTLIATEGER
ncbi:MAG: prepilin-type N-terminal cleavage/methylation domain-containing protein [Planctomycetota bacterium]